MSQMTSLQKAPKAAWKGRILQNTAMVTDRKAQAPVGSGSKTRPAHHTLQVSQPRRAFDGPCMGAWLW